MDCKSFPRPWVDESIMTGDALVRTKFIRNMSILSDKLAKLWLITQSSLLAWEVPHEKSPKGLRLLSLYLRRKLEFIKLCNRLMKVIVCGVSCELHGSLNYSVFTAQWDGDDMLSLRKHMTGTLFLPAFGRIRLNIYLLPSRPCNSQKPLPRPGCRFISLFIFYSLLVDMDMERGEETEGKQKNQDHCSLSGKSLINCSSYD